MISSYLVSEGRSVKMLLNQASMFNIVEQFHDYHLM